MKVLVTGDREWQDAITVRAELSKLPPDTIIIHGACRGLDNMVGVIAKTEFHLEVRPYPAKWSEYGRAAGVIRNQQMLDEEHRTDEPITLCLGFHNSISTSKGTRDMMARAEKLGINTRLVTSTKHRLAPGLGSPVCKHCRKPMSEWRAEEDCLKR